MRIKGGAGDSGIAGFAKGFFVRPRCLRDSLHRNVLGLGRYAKRFGHKKKLKRKFLCSS